MVERSADTRENWVRFPELLQANMTYFYMSQLVAPFIFLRKPHVSIIHFSLHNTLYILHVRIMYIFLMV